MLIHNETKDISTIFVVIFGHESNQMQKKRAPDVTDILYKGFW